MGPMTRRCGLPRASDGLPCQRPVTDGPCGAAHRASGQAAASPPPGLRRLVAAIGPAGTLGGSVDITGRRRTAALAADTHNPDPAVRAAAAGDPATPSADRWALCADAATEVRRAVAGNPAADTDELMACAADPDAAVRSAVAARPGPLPRPVRVWLAVDPDPHVRALIGGRDDLADDEAAALALLA